MEKKTSLRCLTRSCSQVRPKSATTSRTASRTGPSSGSGVREAGRGSRAADRRAAWSASSPRWMGRVATLNSTLPLLGSGGPLDQSGELQVPEVALEGREVERPQLAADPGEGAPEVGRVVDQVGHEAPGVRPVEPRLGLGPVAPALAEDRLLVAGVGAVGGVGLGDGQAEGLLVVAGQPGPRDEVAVVADRAEPLVVEVVGEAVDGQLAEGDLRRLGLLLREVAEDDREPVPPELVRPVRVGQPAERLHVEPSLAEASVGAVEDRQVLDRDRVPVLQPAVADLAAREVPAPADLLDRLERPDPSLGEPVEGESADVTPFDQGEFLDPEILGLTLELHAPIFPEEARHARGPG